jgi:hypothetical protein
MDNRYLYGLAAVLAVAVVTLGLLYASAPTQKDVTNAVDAAVTKANLVAQARETAFQTRVASQIEALKTAYQTELTARDTQISALTSQLSTATATAAELNAEKEAVTNAALVRDQGYVLDKIYLGDTISFNLDDGKLPFLIDGTISFNEDNYDVQERFSLPTGNVFLGYSVVDDEDFASKPYIIVSDYGTFKYQYLFSDPVKMSEVTNDEPLNIKFLGQNVEIVKVTANEVTFRSGTSHYLFEGQSFTVDDKTVTLDFVSENGRVSVTVDGETKVLQEFDHEVIGGLDVRVENILVNSRSGSATLVVGQGVLVTQKNDDNYMDDSQFRFEITTDGSGNLTGLSVIYDEVRETLSDDVKPLALGESLTFPNSFLSVKFDKVLYTDYFTYDVSFKTFNHRLKDGTPINVPSVLLRASSDKGIEVASDNVGEIYIDASNNVYYQDNQGDWLQDSTANTQLVNNDFIVTVAVVGGQLQFATAYSETITADTDFVNKQLGPTQRESEPVDVSYNAAQFGTRDKDVLLASGIVLVNPDTNSGNDRVSFKLPSDRVEAELFISQ